MDLKAEFSRMPFEVLFNTPLAPYTSLHIGGQADFLAFPENEKDLLYLLKFSKNLNLFNTRFHKTPAGLPKEPLYGKDLFLCAQTSPILAWSGTLP